MFVLKNIKNTLNINFNNQKLFLKNTKIIFSIFSKMVIETGIQNEEPKRPIFFNLFLLNGYPLIKTMGGHGRALCPIV